MERIAICISSLFPIDLTSIIYWKEIFPKSKATIWINTSGDRGQIENRSKVARGSLPTFRWLQEVDGTWRLLHLPMDISSKEEILKSFDIAFSHITKMNANVEENLITVKSWLKEQPGKKVDIYNFYKIFLRNVLRLNEIEEIEISNFSDIYNGEIPIKIKENVFSEILRLATNNSKIFVRGGKVLNISTNKLFDRVRKDGQYLILENQSKSYWRVNKAGWITTDLSLKGNLEYLAYSGEEELLGHTPWYCHVDYLSKKTNALEAITPMACHDPARAGGDTEQARLKPLGYSIVDYSNLSTENTISHLLNSDISNIAMEFWTFMYNSHPQVKEKVAKSQKQAASKFYIYCENLFLEFSEFGAGWKQFTRQLGFEKENITSIERLIFLNYALTIIRSWTSCDSAKKPSNLQQQYIKDLLGEDSSYTVEKILREQNEYINLTQNWLAKRGAKTIPKVNHIDTKLYLKTSVFEASISNDLVAPLARRVKEIRALSLAYLSFISFFMGAVCKADLFRTALLSKDFYVRDSIKGIISSRAEKYFQNSIEILS